MKLNTIEVTQDLFVELDDSQQEIVSGGDASILHLVNYTNFTQTGVTGLSGSLSGPGGSMSASGGAAYTIDTSSYSSLYAKAVV